MNKDDVAVYAAVLSTVLLFVKLYEMWKDRFHIDAYLTVDGPDRDKTLYITNLSKTAIHIKYMQLYWKSTSLKRKPYKVVHLDHDFGAGINIGAFETKHISFREADDFGLLGGKQKLFIRLHIAGKRFSKEKRIY
jgi:hypothetical protein